MNKLKQYKIEGLDICSFKVVTAVVSAFCRKDALNVAYAHYHLLSSKVCEVNYVSKCH